MNNYSLQDYKIQREYRDKKRKEYLNQFESLKLKLGLQASHQNTNPKQNVSSPAKLPQQNDENMTKNEKKQSNLNEQSQLMKENAQLKSKLNEIDKQEREKLEKYKSQILVVKQRYMTQIQEVNELAATQKSQNSAKIKKLEQQIKVSTNKNKQISDFNAKLEDECNKAQEIMQKYSTTIQQQYDEKLAQFGKVFNASTQKIQQMENEYNNEDFIEATLSNQQLIQSIKENVQKNDEDIDKMIGDYKQLLNGKAEILQQLSENNKMKEDQITKMAALEQKLKTIFEKLNEEKTIYVQQNNKMTSELLEVKELLAKTLGG